ncbi:hypothetical protein COCMIDRAFT_86749 [Bipolaris oryzae ATCC 44560]|uniref:Uncharacterized protein n=1 Tax=Bipolaris oryzae ATCC 44560 TaxID=930090 RepID=W6ZA42_COCMI|nr:uncharacterized protein COCMIDRAFT_86749 [Bipolaris oryzae ATCC 44560]EUC48617.1 hypothetical protein COCMIDRAFT_86749 [Bipolaris oryzae ATCC 44560]
MTWWRRDSAISPVQRYAQRLLRSHEAALRTRGFSRTPSQDAQHRDDKGTNRPAGMSNLEWAQLQHYQRWRKKLMEDPYQALFGASNSMLSGKGLKDWEWISNSFPKWMLREMSDYGDATPQPKSDKDINSSKRNAKKEDTDYDDSANFKEKESHFLQPSFRATRIGGDDARAIVSPSDLRRPSEQPHVTVIGESIKASNELNFKPQSSTSSLNEPYTFESSPPTPPKSTQSFSDYIRKSNSDAIGKIEKLSKPTTSQGASFMDGFLTEKPPQDEQDVDTHKFSSWRETTLQRRLLRDDAVKKDSNNEPPSILPVAKETETMPPTAVIEEHSPAPQVKQAVLVTDVVQEQKPSLNEYANSPKGYAKPVRSTSETLSQLPEDDIDFLSAAEIRASMGTKKSKIMSDEQRKTERENLEKSFAEAHAETNEVDSMIESKIINDQLVRRIERKMQMPEEPKGMDGPQPTTKTDQTSTLANEAQMESSIDRMKSWLEQGGAIFSSYFWQDPTEEADAKKTRLFFDKVLERIRKGRSTMRQVIEDLETDIPASKALLKRMKTDEDVLDSAIHALRQRSGSGKMHSLTPKKVRAIQSLRLKFQDTDNDLNKAYAALEEISKSEAVKNPPLAFKQRLGLSAKIIQKNAHLTRYLIWSLQARLEDPEIDRSMLVNYKAVANSLLTLRDTQMALSRLVDRAMLVYGVVPQTVEKAELMGQTILNTSSEHGQVSHGVSSSMTEIDKAQLRARIAAEEHLANEVDAQKSAMCGLSDDGYVREPKALAKKSFEERSPLDHSLYRPFGPVLESLGSELPSRIEASKSEEVEQKYNDAELVAEVQKAYEDTYGPITADHQQCPAADEVKHGQENAVEKFEMLKDDPTVSEEAPERVVTTQEPETEVTTLQATENEGTNARAKAETEVSNPTPQLTQISPEPATETAATATSSPIPITDLPTHYIILIHNAETNTLTHTTSTSPPPREPSPTIPLHTALATLSSPSKFIPHITPDVEIITAKSDMLILRNVLAPSSSSGTPRPLLHPPEHSDAADETDIQRAGTVNPIDGTTRLSPTGYVGPEENREQLEKEFEERRRAAERVVLGAGAEGEESVKGSASGAEKKKKGRGAGVVKTAIWAAAVCYVVGVLGEVVA